MGYRPKTDAEREMLDAMVDLQRQNAAWFDYALRLRRQREDHRRLLALTRAYLVRQSELDTTAAAPARDQLVQRLDQALGREAL